VAEPESKVAVVGPRRARDKAAVDEIRVPPHSVEAEQAVLGALMLDNRAWDTIADRLVADDFYRRDHQLIFEAIAELAGRSEPSDAVTLSEWLGRKGVSEETGGLVYLAGLVRDTPSAANVRAYADAVRERSTLRRLITIGGEIASSAFEPEGRAATELVDEAERKVFEIAESGNKAGSGFIALKEELGGVIDRLDMLHQSSGALTGVSTNAVDPGQPTRLALAPQRRWRSLGSAGLRTAASVPERAADVAVGAYPEDVEMSGVAGHRGHCAG